MDVGEVPEPPWSLAGEAVVALAWRTPLATALPAGVRRLPGPVVVIAERWTESSVGPYLALAVGEPARAGTRVGISFSTVVVSSTDARVAEVTFWGRPGECGTLGWHADADGVEVAWEERRVSLRGRVGRRRLPLAVPAAVLQGRAGTPVVVPARWRGQAARARWEIEVPTDDPLGALAGRRAGFHVAGARLALGRATAPAPLFARWRAPASEVEPGLP